MGLTLREPAKVSVALSAAGVAGCAREEVEVKGGPSAAPRVRMFSAWLGIRNPMLAATSATVMRALAPGLKLALEVAAVDDAAAAGADADGILSSAACM